MLIVGSGLMILAGVVFALTSDITLLVITAIIGTISPSGNEVGPFLAIEQAALPQTTTNQQRTHVFAWYSLLGSFTTGIGSLAGGVLSQAFKNAGERPLNSYRVGLIGYALLGAVLGVMFTRLSPAIELAPSTTPPTLKHLFA